jgi:hypothetical protein
MTIFLTPFFWRITININLILIYEMGDRGIVVRYPERQEILLFFNASKPSLGAPTSLLFNEQTAFEM